MPTATPRQTPRPITLLLQGTFVIASLNIYGALSPLTSAIVKAQFRRVGDHGDECSGVAVPLVPKSHCARTLPSVHTLETLVVPLSINVRFLAF